MAQNLITKHIIEAVVKPTLDKAEREKLNADLGRIFADASSIDFNTKETRDSLNNLARAFQAIFDKIGDKSIDFEELIKMPAPDTFAKLGEVAAKQFWSAWESVAKGMNGGAPQDMLREQFNQLKKQRTELVRQQKALPQKQKRYEELSLIADDLPYMDENEFEAFTKKEIEKMGANVDKIALDMQQAMVDALDKLSDISLDDPRYDKALEDAFEKTQKVFKMSRTLEKHPDLVTDKTILDDYDFKYLQETFGEDLEAHSIRLSGLVRKVAEEIDAIPLKLKEIDEQILQIQSSGIEIVDQTSAKNGLKTLNEIEEAYKRILNHKAVGGEFRANQKELDKIQAALNFDPSQSKQGIKSLYEDYLEAAASGNWEAEYQALLKYVRLYEEYQKSENKTHRNKITRPDNPFTPLYEQLKPMAENAQNALQNIVNMAKNQPLVGMGGAGGDGSGDASGEVANAERIAEAKRLAAEKEAEAKKEADAKAEAERRAAEEAERQAKVEKEKAEAIKRQRIETEKLARAAEKKRIADEAAAESRRKAAEEAEREKTATEESIDLRKEELGLIQAMDKFQSEFEKTDKKNETLAFVNTQTGNMSELFVGDTHNVTMDPGTSRKMAELGYDMEVHSHSFKTAAPSIEDFESWFKQLEYIKKFGIRAGEELLAFDFSGFNDKDIESFLQKYKDLDKRISNQFKEMSFDDKAALSLEHGGINEAVQIFLRRGLEDIVKNSFPDIMSSTKMQDLPIDRIQPQGKSSSFVDIWNQASEEVRALIKELAILEHQIDELEERGQDAGDLIARSDTIYDSLPKDIAIGLSDKDWEAYVKSVGAEAKANAGAIKEAAVTAEQAVDGLVEKYNQAPDELKRTYQEIVILQDQIDELERKTQKVPIDIDPWNATKEQKDQIVAAWREYQKVIQEIANMPIVETEDDEKRLLELKAKAVSLYETMRQGHLNDVLGDGYVKEYGLSAEEGRQMHLDMQDEPRKDFDKSLGGLRSKLDEAYLAAQKLDQEMYVMMLRADDDIIESLYDRIRQDALAAKSAVEAVNDSIEETKNVTQGSGTGTGTRGASSVKLEAEDLARRATEESNVKDGIIRELREQLANIRTSGGEEQASVSSEELKNVLSSIVYSVKIIHDDADKASNKIAIDENALESTLNRVFANVINPEVEQVGSEPKDAPWALEKTLLSVKEVLDGIRTNTTKTELVEVAPASTEVGNVLATENTLAAIKTAVEAINKKVVKGTKAKKAEDGGRKKSAESYAGSQYFPEKLKTQTMQLAKFRAQLMTTGKLTDDVDAQIYELLDGLKQIQNGPDFSAWSQKFQQLKTSVGITDIFDKADGKEAAASYQQLIEFQKTRNKLELQYERAQDGSALKQFYAEQLAQMDSIIAKQQEMLDNEEYEAKLAKIQADQARKLGEIEAKAADKFAKDRLKEETRLTKKQALTGKAGNAIGRAEGVWMEALSLDEDSIPQAFIERINEYNKQLDMLRKKHLEISSSKGPISKEQQKDLIAQTVEINEQTTELGELISEYQRLSGANTTTIGASTLGNNATISEYEQALKQAVMTATDGKAQIKGFDHNTKTLTYTLKTGKNEFTEYTAAVRHLDQQYTSTAGKTKRMETFLEATKRKMKELTSYFSGMAIFNRIGQELRRGIQYVREIDLALTELKKVTDETEETYDRFLDTAAKTGARLGATISAVTEATATFAKLGYSMEQATEMAEAAIVYKNVGDNIASTEDAADSIISTMKGFGLEATESMKIVDRFNEVGNRFAITSQGIGEALRLSASALSEGGNSLDESIGLITAANEVVNDPSSVGTALKTKFCLCA